MAAAAGPAAAPTALPPGLIIPGMGPDGSIGPATGDTSASNVVITVNGKRYHLLKYLGGGTYGKVWAVLDESDGTIKTLKFIKYDQPGKPAYEKEQYEKAKKEVILQQLVHTTNLAVCSPVYGVGNLTVAPVAATETAPTFDGGKYIIFCADRYTKTLEVYLYDEYDNIGDNLPAKQQLVTDVLYGLYRTLKSVNIPGRVRFNHGDPNFNNYMIFDGVIRMIDVAFGHYESDGLNIIGEPSYNSNNNDLMRDLLHNVLYIYIYESINLIKELNYIASCVMRIVNAKFPDPDPVPADGLTYEARLFYKVFEYLNLPGSHEIIEGALDRIIPILTTMTSTARVSSSSPVAPKFATSNANASELARLAAARSAPLEENHTLAVAKVFAALPKSSQELDITGNVTLEDLLRTLASRDDRNLRVDPRMAVGPAMGHLQARVVAGEKMSAGMAALLSGYAGIDGGSSGGAAAASSSASAPSGVSSTPGFAPSGYGGGGGFAASTYPPFTSPTSELSHESGGAAVAETNPFRLATPGGASSTSTGVGGAGGPSGGGWAPASSHAASVALGSSSYKGTNPFEGGRRSRSRSRTQKKRKTKTKSKHSKTRSRKTA